MHPDRCPAPAQVARRNVPVAAVVSLPGEHHDPMPVPDTRLCGGEGDCVSGAIHEVIDAFRGFGIETSGFGGAEDRSHCSCLPEAMP
jgi:hypothetical protein